MKAKELNSKLEKQGLKNKQRELLFSVKGVKQK